MKKIIYPLALILLISCSSEDTGKSEENPSELKEGITTSQEINEHKEEENDVIDLGGKEVWEVYDTDEILTVTDKVFTLKYADRLENKLLEVLEKEPNNWRDWGNYLGMFTAQTNDKPTEYGDYFVVLTDV